MTPDKLVETVGLAMKTWKFAAPMLNGYRICGTVREGDSTSFPWKTFTTAAEAYTEMDRLNARSAILTTLEGIREATPEIAEAGFKSINKWPLVDEEDEPTICWHAMLDRLIADVKGE